MHNRVCYWDKPSVSLDKGQGRPKDTPPKKCMFMCLYLAWRVQKDVYGGSPEKGNQQLPPVTSLVERGHRNLK